MKDNCTFCELDEQSAPYKDDPFFIKFDANPVTAGHLIIISKRHIESLSSLSQDEWEQLQRTVENAKDLVETTDLLSVYREFIENPLDQTAKKFSQDILDKQNLQEEPDGYNIGVNEGRAAGQTVDHLHIHVIPRYDGDVDNPTGGVRSVISAKGDYTS